MSIWQKIVFNWKHLGAQPNPARAFTAYFLAKAQLCPWICFKRNEVLIRLRPAGLARILWTDPAAVLDGEVFLSKALRKGSVFVDVGANIGILTLLASRSVGNEGRVVAIEAHPRTHAALLDNLRLNAVKNVETVNCAVGERPGVIRFSDRPDDDWNKVDTTCGDIEIELRRLDEVCASLPSVDILKIDVEGYELPVLKGAGQLLSRTHCVLLECWNEHTNAFGYAPQDLMNWMKGLSFQGYRLCEEGGQPVLTPLEPEHQPEGLENWVFVKDKRWIGEQGTWEKPASAKA